MQNSNDPKVSSNLENQFCPECGCGTVAQTETGIVHRLPRNYPYDKPCETCRRRSIEAARKLGAEIAKRQIEAVLKALENG